MSRTLRTLVPVAVLTVGLGLPASAAHDTSTTQYQDVLGQCGRGDLLVADFTIQERSSVKGDREQLHLHLTGTITRTGTGVVGSYAETQLDTFGVDGSESYSGTLSRLVVPGGGVLRAAGHAEFSADGDVRFTPGLAALADDGFVSDVCDLLA